MSNLFSFQLHTEKTFYLSFLDDLERCREEVIIESPYITSERTSLFIPVFEKLLEKGVRTYVMTRDPKEHALSIGVQSEEAIRTFEIMGHLLDYCKLDTLAMVRLYEVLQNQVIDY
ncbi:MAG: hypothetical protein COX78_04370 [Candidatus Levybacteria bacterium CG_4_10_14_0_2_um_filter_35_8]|nr:MAG: hypothetical protein COW87_02240 [Candidatus Levybacteria bacterium CG22_combo_CG10-13_8_21_14_all_35_11]PIY94724.1 MAG: hypothetical protein COY68_01490 [Candidatus Levybacteria bacterium CG_4_10_14_0_8_um_filter_35_23]PIZ97687.1 MAG: hypothetical protein COX78_04370 [Candidatus Levybacteria bacterium CG_4_10_14_0_2_um_filter_35_8]